MTLSLSFPPPPPPPPPPTAASSRETPSVTDSSTVLSPFPVPPVQYHSVGGVDSIPVTELLVQSFPNAYVISISQKNKLGSVIHVTQGGSGIDVRLGDRSNPLFHVLGRSVGSLFRDKELVLTCCLIDHTFDFEPASDYTISAGQEDARQSRMSRQLVAIMEGLGQCKIKLASPSTSASATTTSHPSPVHSTEI